MREEKTIFAELMWNKIIIELKYALRHSRKDLIAGRKLLSINCECFEKQALTILSSRSMHYHPLK
jgi:hypothetical protein